VTIDYYKILLNIRSKETSR